MVKGTESWSGGKAKRLWVQVLKSLCVCFCIKNDKVEDSKCDQIGAKSNLTFAKYYTCMLYFNV